MAFFDLPLAKLETFELPDYEPGDFDAFWKSTLAETAKLPLEAGFSRLEHPLCKLIDVYDVTFAGFAGNPIKAWFIEPAGNKRKLPCVVTYLGYGGGRGTPVDHLSWAAAGYANLVMDTRGQGSVWGTAGSTPDPFGSGPQIPGFMTRGVETPQTYYYRRVFVDAVRAIEAAASHEHVDASRMAVTGGSQGGGITIAAAALAGDKVKLAMPDVPFLCAYRRATGLIESPPYDEITRYLKIHREKVEQTFQTLAYHDGVNFAPRIKARCLFSVGLMDKTCPPSTVYAAYNRIKAPKEIRVWEYNNHEGGGSSQVMEKIEFTARHL